MPLPPPLLFRPADAHEGCVWVPDQRRLYFSTTKKLPDTTVSIDYLDFSELGDPAAPGYWDRTDATTLAGLPVRSWVADANMANSFRPSRDGRALLVAEQGKPDTAARIARYPLDGSPPTTVTDHLGGLPYNSPNKVIVSARGHLIFSDPDYGFRQGFRPPPQLRPSLYVIPAGATEPVRLGCDLLMPHGLALTPQEDALFVTDTSSDGAHDGASVNRERDVYRYPFDPATGLLTGPGAHCFGVNSGVPDGCITVGDAYLVGAGDGVYVADLAGQLRGLIRLEHTAVNLCAAGHAGQHLLVTADAGVYLIRNWRDRLGA